MDKTVNVRVSTNAKSNKVVALDSGVLKVYTTRPAVDGKANKSVLEIIARHYKVKKNTLVILKGLRSRDKVIAFTNR